MSDAHALAMVIDFAAVHYQQLGAGVARGAHNPEVAGSKPAVASLSFCALSGAPQ